MTPLKDGASVETLREAARAFVDATSLRHAARDIGMSPTGLRGFIDGADPYVKTARKLTEWYVREIQRRHGDLTAETSSAAINLLVKHLPLNQRDRAAEELVAVLERQCRDAGVSSPPWLTDLSTLAGGAEGNGTGND